MKSYSDKIFIGTMSGTSHDGIDICSLSISNKKIKLLEFSSYKYPDSLKKDIANIIQHQELGLRKYLELNKKIGTAFSKSINRFIAKNYVNKNQILAIGLSGQTLFHAPKHKYPFSIQAGDPKIVSMECGIDVVSDFRNDHINLGGEGAPLVPEFHQKIFARKNSPLAVLNIGGISNFTYLDGKESFYGSDCGPGNALLDAYCQNFLNLPYDKNGDLAKKGRVHKNALKKMLGHPFFKKRHPKSTGKEVFNIKFIPKELLKKSSDDILATLTELTAICITKSINKHKKLPEQIIVCGGGIKNKFLINSIKKLSKIGLVSSSEFGFNPQAIEAMAFGWMASQRIYKNPHYVKDNKGLLGKITRSKQ
mgnify:CR=1 FL=1